MAPQPVTEPLVAPLVSVEEYLNSIYHPDCDYNEGFVEERNLGEFEHSFLQINIGTLFTNHIEEWGVFGLTEQRTQLGPNRYVIPDVAVLRMGTPRERILTRPPLITIEIMSPKDTLREVTAKSLEYLAFGVENIWVINPETRRAYCATETGLELVPSGDLTVQGTPILLRASELFEKLDRF